MGENEQDAGQYDERGQSYEDYYTGGGTQDNRGNRRQRELSNLPDDFVPGS